MSEIKIKKRNIRGILDYLETVLLAFFVAMDTIVLVILIQESPESAGKIFSEYIIIFAAIVLFIVLIIKFITKFRDK